LARGVLGSCFLWVLSWSGPAHAQAAAVNARSVDGAEAPLHGVAAVSVGRGLRFNNPFRLAAPLGDTAESVSLSATYLDLTLGVLWEGARGFQHGVGLGGVVAMDGIGQFGLTPSYLVQVAVSRGLGLRGRAGVPVVVAPDTTFGLEAALGSNLAVAFGFGLTAELVGSVFFGAATEEASITTIPMLSVQMGMFFDHEIVL
jgi:hypothetical protein